MVYECFALKCLNFELCRQKKATPYWKWKLGDRGGGGGEPVRGHQNYLIQNRILGARGRPAFSARQKLRAKAAGRGCKIRQKGSKFGARRANCLDRQVVSWAPNLDSGLPAKNRYYIPSHFSSHFSHFMSTITR